MHEVRSPLSVIIGAADLLLKEASTLSADQIKTLLSQIKTSSRNLLDMVNDILDISKMQAGKFEVSKKQGNLLELLKEQSTYFQASANLKGIKIRVTSATDIAQPLFDPDRMRQVMINLLSNAIKYSPDNTEIVIDVRRHDRYCEVAVCDQGKGIPEDEKDTLFNRFAQAANHNNIKEKGTGLGLYITKGIIDAHGGQIWIEDNKPVGTKFIFYLPLD